MTREWIPVEDVAARWFGEDTVATRARVRRAIRAETVPARKIGRRWLIHGDVLDALARGGDNPSVMAHASNTP